MSPVAYSALIFSVIFMVATAYFFMGGLPLLTLKHDVPLDARFIRSFFNVYYRSTFWIAMCACASFAVWGRYAFATGALAVAGSLTLLSAGFLSAMQRVGARIEASESGAIRSFRRLHVAVLGLNLTVLAVVIWGMAILSQQLK